MPLDTRGRPSPSGLWQYRQTFIIYLEASMKNLILIIALGVFAFGCVSQQERQIAEEGYKFSTGKNREQVMDAIVATMVEENLTATNINESFGIISTGKAQISSQQIEKWTDVNYGVYIAETELTFNVTKDGVVTIKYCEKTPYSGGGRRAIVGQLILIKWQSILKIKSSQNYSNTSVKELSKQLRTGPSFGGKSLNGASAKCR